MKPRSTASAASGWSRQVPWPASGSTTSRPQGGGMAAAISRASSTGVTGSCSPASTSTGQHTAASPGRRSIAGSSARFQWNRMSRRISVRVRASGSAGGRGLYSGRQRSA